MSTTEGQIAKSLVKKYDRRALTSAENGRRAWGQNLEQQIAELEDRIRALADSTDDQRLKFEALRYLLDRRAGKPYVATNPNQPKQVRVTDQRLQIAIQQLISTDAKPVESAAPSIESKLVETQGQLATKPDDPADAQADRIVADMLERSRVHSPYKL
jgi:hypothetical protein